MSESRPKTSFISSLFDKKTPKPLIGIIFDKDFATFSDGCLINENKQNPQIKTWCILTNIHEQTTGKAPVIVVHYTNPSAPSDEGKESKDAGKICETLLALTKHGWMNYINVDRLQIDIRSGVVKAGAQLTEKDARSFFTFIQKQGFDFNNLYVQGEMYRTSDPKYLKFQKIFDKVVKPSQPEPQSAPRKSI